MSNATIFVLIGIAIIVVIARKWDSFKWILGLAVVVLGLWTAYKMGMFDSLFSNAKVPKVQW